LCAIAAVLALTTGLAIGTVAFLDEQATRGIRAELDTRVGPDLALLDWQMPRLDGRGVLRAVAAEPQLAMTHRFVLITANDVAGDGTTTAAVLAQAIIGGLTASVLLTIFIVPAAYVLIYQRRETVALNA